MTDQSVIYYPIVFFLSRKKLVGSWYEIESLVKEGIDVQESPVLGFLIMPLNLQLC